MSQCIELEDCSFLCVIRCVASLLNFTSYFHILIYSNLIQNLNFTGFRKILKKHDKILDTQRGADWRVAHVEVAPFYTCKKITQLISETEVDCLSPRLDF